MISRAQQFSRGRDSLPLALWNRSTPPLLVNMLGGWVVFEGFSASPASFLRPSSQYVVNITCEHRMARTPNFRTPNATCPCRALEIEAAQLLHFRTTSTSTELSAVQLVLQRLRSQSLPSNIAFLIDKLQLLADNCASVILPYTVANTF